MESLPSAIRIRIGSRIFQKINLTIGRPLHTSDISLEPDCRVERVFLSTHTDSNFHTSARQNAYIAGFPRISTRRHTIKLTCIEGGNSKISCSRNFPCHTDSRIIRTPHFQISILSHRCIFLIYNRLYFLCVSHILCRHKTWRTITILIGESGTFCQSINRMELIRIQECPSFSS